MGLPGGASGKEPACQCRRHKESWVQYLSWKDLEEIMATHSRILAWKILWTEEAGGLQSLGISRVGHDLATNPMIIHNVEHLFVCLLAICMSSLYKCLFRYSAYFLIGLFAVLILSFMGCLYILEINCCQLLCLQMFSPILKLIFSPLNESSFNHLF